MKNSIEGVAVIALLELAAAFVIPAIGASTLMLTRP